MPKTFITREDQELNRIHANLYIIRSGSGISQKEIGAELGISRQAYSLKERTMNMSLKEFLAVCHKLGADPGNIITEACR